MEQINRDALFCDETEDYRCPSEADAGEVVTFYFRTEKNGADAVVLLEYDPETGALFAGVADETAFVGVLCWQRWERCRYKSRHRW